MTAIICEIFQVYKEQMIMWILLLALVVFLMYMWQAGWVLGGKEEKPGCATCPGKKNPNVV